MAFLIHKLKSFGYLSKMVVMLQYVLMVVSEYQYNLTR